MRTILLFILVAFATGCTYEGQNLRSYLENPRSIIRDPHFTEYKQKRDDLEHKYLSKDISYAEYVKEMDSLEEKYSQEVQEREAVVVNR